MKGKTFFASIITLLATAALLFGAMKYGGDLPPNVKDGEVLAVHAGSVVRGLSRALEGDTGTFILRDITNAKYVFVWNINSAYAWIALDTSQGGISTVKSIFQGGNLGNVKTLSDLMLVLKSTGWSEIQPNAVPEVFFNAIAAAGMWLATNNISLTEFMMVVPGGVHFAREAVQGLPGMNYTYYDWSVH